MCSKKSEKKGVKESGKRRIQGFEDSRGQVVLLESFFKTKKRRIPFTLLFHLLHLLPSFLIPKS